MWFSAVSVVACMHGIHSQTGKVLKNMYNSISFLKDIEECYEGAARRT